MEATTAAFEKRWATISRETLAAVRRQYRMPEFDNSAIVKASRNGSDEWFDGELAPHVWYESLEKERPEAAREFRDYVNGIGFTERAFSKPSMLWGWLVTAVSLAACFFLLGWLSDMGFLSRALTAVGTAVLVWYASLTLIRSRDSRIEEEVVDYYRDQLERNLEHIRKILS